MNNDQYPSGKVGPAEQARLAASVGALLKTYREGLGWSMRRLAKRAGLTASTISRLESGELRPRAETLAALAVAMSDEGEHEAMSSQLCTAAGDSLRWSRRYRQRWS